MKNFAYGSNLCRGRLLGRVPDATFEVAARLPRHSLRFHKRSNDGSGKGDAFFTDDQTDEVWGVIVDVPDHQRPLLDQAEGLGYGYLDQEVTVFESAGDSHSAIAYLAVDRYIDPALRPFDWYLRLVVRGATAHGLPKEYIKRIASLPSLVDPQPHRRSRPPDTVVC